MKGMPDGQQIIALVTCQGREVLGGYEVRKPIKRLVWEKPSIMRILVSVQHPDAISTPESQVQQEALEELARVSLTRFISFIVALKFPIHLNNHLAAEQVFQYQGGETASEGVVGNDHIHVRPTPQQLERDNDLDP